MEGQLRHIGTGRGKRTGRAKLPKVQGTTAGKGSTSKYPVVSREVTKIVGSLLRISLINRGVAA